MYHFDSECSDIFQQGVDEGRRQVLADIAKIVQDNTKDSEGDPYIFDIGNDVCEYIEQEGFL